MTHQDSADLIAKVKQAAANISQALGHRCVSQDTPPAGTPRRRPAR